MGLRRIDPQRLGDFGGGRELVVGAKVKDMRIDAGTRFGGDTTDEQ